MLPFLLQTVTTGTGFYCSEAAPFFGFAGVSCALVFASQPQPQQQQQRQHSPVPCSPRLSASHLLLSAHCFSVSSADLGAAYGTLKSGVGITSMGTVNSEAVMKNIIPVVMAGVLGIYGLIIAVILTQQGQQTDTERRLPHLRLSACPLLSMSMWLILSSSSPV